MITQTQKTEIQWHLKNYAAGFSSQKQAANSLKDCSEATVINIIGEKWDSISDKMWIHLSKLLKVGKQRIVPVETLDFTTLINYFSLAKEEGATFAITGNAGFGKSFSAGFFAETHRSKNAYLITCAEYWNKKMFLCNILQQMGKEYAGMNVGELMEAIVRELGRMHQPLIILDEIDKLKDDVLKFFITLYNDLFQKCGFIWLSTDNIEKRMRKGLNLNRNGYKELYSRIGSKFITLKGTTREEVQQICQENGVTDANEIGLIVNTYGGDLRRVERSLLKSRMKEIANRKTKAA